MKVRWREHELILFTLFVILIALGSIFRIINSSVPFAESFRFYRYIFYLQGITSVIQYGCYVWLNKFIIAKLYTPKSRWAPIVQAIREGAPLPGKNIALITLKYLWLAIQFIILIYMLGPVCNFVAYYYGSFYPDRGMVYLAFSFLPPHPQEFYNVFGGYDMALFFTCFYLAYAAIREAAISTIQRQNNGRQFRVMITNQITLAATAYLALFPLLFVFSSPGYMFGQSTIAMYFFVIPATAVVFICNIYWLFPLKGEKPLLRSGIVGRLLFLTFVCSIPVMFLQRAQIEGVFTFLIVAWLIQLLVITPLSWKIYQWRKDKILQLRGVEKALEESRASLQFLRSQINPHFLFNALNTLYGTALTEDASRTAEGIQKLGDMMRFMLHENALDYIPMNKEIEYLENYIELQKLRIQSSPDIVIEDNISKEYFGHSIAPMLLIPFVENAFKHGISLAEKSWINITLTCDEKNILFSVRNSMHNRKGTDTEKENSGIGLKNVQERLRLLYPGKYQLTAQAEGNEFFAVLNIQP